MAGYITSHLVPVRVHVREQRDEFKRLGDRVNAHWTPTILLIDRGTGEERHRIEGFLPAQDFLAQLALGAAHAAFARSDFSRAFDAIGQTYPDSDAAHEAQYWAGVSRYKASGDAAALVETARQFDERYQDTSWAKRASVWRRRLFVAQRRPVRVRVPDVAGHALLPQASPLES